MAVETALAKRHVRKPVIRAGTIDVAKAMRLRIINKLSYEAIAKQLDCSRGGVINALKDFERLVPSPEARQVFQENKAEILEAVQLKLTSSLIDPAKIKKATLGNVAYAVSKLHDMTRLERNQSTNNVSVLSRLIDDSHTSLFAGKPQHIDEANPFE